jgi:hypothetical protein
VRYFVPVLSKISFILASKQQQTHTSTLHGLVEKHSKSKMADEVVNTVLNATLNETAKNATLSGRAAATPHGLLLAWSFVYRRKALDVEKILAPNLKKSDFGKMGFG